MLEWKHTGRDWWENQRPVEYAEMQKYGFHWRYSEYTKHEELSWKSTSRILLTKRSFLAVIVKSSNSIALVLLWKECGSSSLAIYEHNEWIEYNLPHKREQVKELWYVKEREDIQVFQNHHGSKEWLTWSNHTLVLIRDLRADCTKEIGYHPYKSKDSKRGVRRACEVITLTKG